MGPRWRLIRSRELLSKETFQQHEVKMSYNLPLDFQWNMEVQIPVHLHKKKTGQIFCLFFDILVQSLNYVQLFAMPWTAACQASLSFTISQSLLTVMSIESMMPSSHLILCHPLLCLPSIFPSIKVFSNGSALCFRWPKYWSFSISP